LWIVRENAGQPFAYNKGPNKWRIVVERYLKDFAAIFELNLRGSAFGLPLTRANIGNISRKLEHLFQQMALHSRRDLGTGWTTRVRQNKVAAQAIRNDVLFGQGFVSFYASAINAVANWL
jgi:hypothetical protein